MKEKKQSEELQSRREFFKQAAKKALPVIGAIALAGSPIIAQATISEPMGCVSNACANGCAGGCSRSCQSSCARNCKGQSSAYGYGCETCKTACTGCTGGCNGTCSGSCSVSSYAL